MLQKKLLLQLLFLALAVLSFSPLISPPIALLFGILFVNIFGKVLETDSFVKKLLQYSIIGLGFGINLNTAIEAGSQGFLFTVSTIALVMIFGLLLAKILKIDKRKPSKKPNKIIQLDLDNNFIKEWSSASEIENILKSKKNYSDFKSNFKIINRKTLEII